MAWIPVLAGPLSADCSGKGVGFPGFLSNAFSEVNRICLPGRGGAAGSTQSTQVLLSLPRSLGATEYSVLVLDRMY